MFEPACWVIGFGLAFYNPAIEPNFALFDVVGVKLEPGYD
jgi:hypothetical protein